MGEDAENETEMFRFFPRTARPTAVITLCALAIIAEGYDLIVYGALIPSLLKEPGWYLDASDAGTIGSCFYVGMLVGAVASGQLSDRYGRRGVVLASVAWLAVWTMAFAAVGGPWQLGAFRFLAGIGMGVSCRRCSPRPRNAPLKDAPGSSSPSPWPDSRSAGPSRPRSGSRSSPPTDGGRCSPSAPPSRC